MILFTSFSFRSPPLCLCVIILPPARVPNRAGEYQIVRKKRHRKKSVPLLKVLINLFQKVAVSKGRAFCRRPQTAKSGVKSDLVPSSTAPTMKNLRFFPKHDVEAKCSRRFFFRKARSRRLLFFHCACRVGKKGVKRYCKTSRQRADEQTLPSEGLRTSATSPYPRGKGRLSRV